jgi:hypothetical protein
MLTAHFGCVQRVLRVKKPVKWRRRKRIHRARGNGKSRTTPTETRSGLIIRRSVLSPPRRTRTLARSVMHTILILIHPFSGPGKPSVLPSRSRPSLSMFTSALTRAQSLRPCARRTERISSKDLSSASLTKTRRFARQSSFTSTSTTGQTG